MQCNKPNIFFPPINIEPITESKARVTVENKNKFSFIFQVVNQSTSIVVDEYCNAVTIINQGTTLINVNGLNLNKATPGTNNGESVSFGGHINEIFVGRLDINFTASTGQAMIVQKIYIK